MMSLYKQIMSTSDTAYILKTRGGEGGGEREGKWHNLNFTDYIMYIVWHYIQYNAFIVLYYHWIIYF